MQQQTGGHTLKAFDQDLERLRALIGEMGELAEQAIGEAMRCLVQRDVEGAAKLVEDDIKLDELEIETERRAVQLIALRAPMAGDLRDVVAALKISGVVERIGDYAKNIARRVPEIDHSGKIEPLSLLPEMARIASEMVHDVLLSDRPILALAPLATSPSSSATPKPRSASPSATTPSTISTIPSSGRC